MDELLNELLKQSPLVILMVVGYYVMLKEKTQIKKEAIAERKAHNKALDKLIESHNIEKKELNDYIRESDKETSDALGQIALALEAVKMYIKETTKK